VVLALSLLVAATNRWMSWDAGTRLLTARDVGSYEAIARAAPGLPSRDLPAHHAERFPVHWVTGALSDLSGVPLHALYRVLLVAAIVGTLVALHGTVTGRLAAGAHALVFAAFLLDPYVLRYELLVPGMLADATFVLAVGVTIFGLARRRPWAVLGGIALATAARETALPAALVVIAWVALAPDWRALPRALRRRVAAGVAVVAAGIWAVTRAVAGGFSAPALPGVHDASAVASGYSLPAPSLSTLDDYTILGTLSAPGTLAEHVARVATPLIMPTALVVAALVVARRMGVRPPVAFWASLAMAASIVAQPLLVSPAVLANNETRLAALGVLPLVAALALLLERIGPRLRERLQGRDLAGIGVVLAIGSLHHLYTVVGPTSASQIAPLQLVAGALAGWLLVRAATRQAPPAVAGGA
jgi:hypothetical protein